MSKPMRLQIADAILDYLHKHHGGDFDDLSEGDRYQIGWLDTGPVDLLDIADAVMKDARLSG